MASVSTHYIGTGKSLVYDGSPVYTIYGEDFNPPYSEIPDPPSDRGPDTLRTSGETSFNLSGFQNGNEICFCGYILSIQGVNSIDVTMRFQFKEGNNYYDAGWDESYTTSYTSTSRMSWKWYYVGIDYDEVWMGHTNYRFLIQVEAGGQLFEFEAPFSVYNMNFDATRHNSGYIRVDGNNLCYTDASYTSNRGYKHKINRDSTYSSTYVGTDKAGYIWLSTNTSDRRIYYVDENGYTRRTNPGQSWLDENDDYAGTNKTGYMRVSDGYDSGYAHLCYVDASGYKRRICNGGI